MGKPLWCMVGSHDWRATETPDHVVGYTEEPFITPRWNYAGRGVGRYIFYREYGCKGCGKVKKRKMQGTPRRGADYS